MKQWVVYLVRCRDNSLYCGITNDLEKRLAAHNAGAGAKYIVPARRPVTLAFKELAQDKSAALTREAQIKKLPKKKKELLIINSS